MLVITHLADVGCRSSGPCWVLFNEPMSAVTSLADADIYSFSRHLATDGRNVPYDSLLNTHWASSIFIIGPELKQC